jgi:predicted RNA binding protein YcfA (HicA-like mRNA interferase family)
MKLPRDISGAELVRALGRAGYAATRQRGSHVTLTTQRFGEHHVTVPLHSPMKIGTLASILAAVAKHLQMERDELLRQLEL